MWCATLFRNTVTAGDEDMGAGYIGAYEAPPTAVGLQDWAAAQVVMPIALLVLVLSGFSGVVVWRRYHSTSN